MRRNLWVSALLLASLQAPMAWAATDEAMQLFKKGVEAYNTGQMEQALDLYKQAVKADPSFTDAYFNQAAILFNQGRYQDALDAFNKLLQIDPNDQTTRYETAKVYEKMGRYDEAIAAFEMVGPTSSRYAKAQEHISDLRAKKKAGTDTAAASNTPASTTASTVNVFETPAQSDTSVASTAGTGSLSPSIADAPTKPTGAKFVVQDIATGLSGPTGVAVDAKGTLYVANFSKNTIVKVSPGGEKKLLASGAGINGPVGLTLDRKTGDIYIANHLDNTIARISPQGKVSVIATGLKKPYNLFLDEAQRMLYVSQLEQNTVSRIPLN